MVFYQMLKFIIAIFIIFIVVSISSILNIELNLTALDHVLISTPFFTEKDSFFFHKCTGGECLWLNKVACTNIYYKAF